jgi:septum formation protein
VARLASEKAGSVMQMALWKHGAALIIAADTIVVAPDGRTVLGKPRDEAEARRMLGKLAGRTHTVLTGYCILAAAREMEPERIVRVVTSRVTMRKLDKSAIERYVASGEPMDKAGAYAAQGLGNALIDRISGSYTNVVGLPMTQLLQDLERKFELPLFGGVKPGSLRVGKP